MKRLLVIMLGFVLLLSHPASSLTLNKVLLTDDLHPDLSMQESMVLYLDNVSRGSFNFTFPEGASNVFINGKQFSVITNPMMIPLDCTSCKVNINYALDGVTKSVPNYRYIFSRTLSFPLQPDFLNYTVLLPSGQVISSSGTQSEPAIVPVPQEIRTDGQRIMVVWSEVNPNLPIRYFVQFVGHESIESPAGELGTELSEWPVWLLMFICLFVGFIMGWFINRFYTKRYSDTALPYVPSSLLTNDEQKIVKQLKENHNHMNQKDVGKKLNWSKSKVSAIMTNLEFKKVVSREKQGRNYEVRLIKAIED